MGSKCFFIALLLVALVLRMPYAAALFVDHHDHLADQQASAESSSHMQHSEVQHSEAADNSKNCCDNGCENCTYCLANFISCSSDMQLSSSHGFYQELSARIFAIPAVPLFRPPIYSV